MGSAFDGVYVVGVGKEQLVIPVGILHCNFHLHVVLYNLEVDYFLVKNFLVLVYVSYEFRESAFVVENFLFLLVPVVGKGDSYTLIEECHLSETVLQGSVVVYGFVEYFRIRPESGLGTGLLGRSYNLERSYGLAFCVFLSVDISVSLYLYFHFGGKGVYYGSAYAVKTSGYLVSSAAEFSSGMKNGMNNLHRRDSQLGMLVYGHTSSVVLDGYGIILIYSYRYVPAITGKGFVHTVIHYLVNEMVKTSRSRASDVHSRSFPYGLKTL